MNVLQNLLSLACLATVSGIALPSHLNLPTDRTEPAEPAERYPQGERLWSHLVYGETVGEDPTEIFTIPENAPRLDPETAVTKWISPRPVAPVPEAQPQNDRKVRRRTASTSTSSSRRSTRHAASRSGTIFERSRWSDDRRRRRAERRNHRSRFTRTRIDMAGLLDGREFRGRDGKSVFERSNWHKRVGGRTGATKKRINRALRGVR